MSALALGLPSKGRLQAECVSWFKSRGIEIARDGSDRQYSATATGIDGLEVVMLPAGEMPRALADGRIHLGVTGEDMIRERLPQHESQVRMIAPMGFGQADLVVAVPAFWLDVEDMHDLDEVAHDFRAQHGFPLRVATKYHNLARSWFRDHGVAEYRLVDSQGATEATPANQTAEVIVDITTTGSTLVANQLKPLTDGPILRSQAMLCASLIADWSSAASDALRTFESRI